MLFNLIPLLESTLAQEQRIQRDRAKRRLERPMAREVAAWFVDQGKAIVKQFEPIVGWILDFNATAVQEGVVRESLTYAQWVWIFEQIAQETGLELVTIIDGYTQSALQTGATAVLRTPIPGMNVSFDLRNPRAVAYAEGRAASQVTRINETTRDRLNALIVEAVDNGWSWNRTASKISALFEDMAGPPLFPSKKFTSRAQMIAAYEIGDAYEAGSEIAAGDLAAQGLAMEKMWLTVGDSKVRIAHSNNQAQGWIPMDQAHESGHMRPPTDGGCRCTELYRVKGDER